MKTYNRCSLCFEGGTEEFYNKMINYDGLVLCSSCYERYKENEYNKMVMLRNGIRMYRRILESLDKEDKVINLMAEVIEECRQNGCIEFNEEIDLSDIAGEEMIKEYFYKKVEKEYE